LPFSLPGTLQKYWPVWSAGAVVVVAGCVVVVTVAGCVVVVTVVVTVVDMVVVVAVVVRGGRVVVADALQSGLGSALQALSSTTLPL